jgi:predicted DNA-binding ribbon-helix-helix protein
MQANTGRPRPPPSSPGVLSGGVSCTRHLSNGSKSTAGQKRRTTVALEPEFWAAIEGLANRRGLTWRDWAEIELAGKPKGRSAATWLRVRCLTDYLQEV